MALAELIGKLRTQKQATSRTAFQRYLQTVKALANGSEVDADEVSDILTAAGKDEDHFEADVNLQSQRLAWHAQLTQNHQATQDRRQAELDMAEAQAKLQAAYDKLMPAVDHAQARIDVANQTALYTQQAEHRLTETIIDTELLQRESETSAKLSEVNAELKPLLVDRSHKASSLMNAELVLRQLTGRNPDDWKAWGITSFFHKTQDIKAAESRVDDVQSELAQLDAAIKPRQIEQRRLQTELTDIHAEKLLP
jgi:hypothetical protein